MLPRLVHRPEHDQDIIIKLRMIVVYWRHTAKLCVVKLDAHKSETSRYVTEDVASSVKKFLCSVPSALVSLCFHSVLSYFVTVQVKV